MRKKWIIPPADTSKIQKIADELNVSALTAKILYNRGIIEFDAAKNFLSPETAPFHDPFEMLGMREAVDRIIAALKSKEKICIYGDYDVDGMSASAILIRTLKRFGAEVESYIPSRAEGYGLNLPALQKIIDEGFKLLISVDCGISNEQEISAVKISLDVIVTDHHLPALEEVKSAIAVVDPNQQGCSYPEKNLCGAGVVFKISQALAHEINGIDIQEYATDIELAALATVADIVKLVGENRKITYMGLRTMSQSKCIGLNALIEEIALGGKKISTGHVAFQIAPRLNSVGRLYTASEGLRLLLTEDPEEARILAKKLDTLNKQRKDIEANILMEVEAKVQELRIVRGGDLSTLVIDGVGWQEGVIGLAASKLVEKYNLPTIILTTNDGQFARGSCRSIPTFHIKDALDTMADLFEQYGGHSQAAGLTIKIDKIPEFKSRFDEYVRKKLCDEDFQPILNIDAIIHPAQINLEIAKELNKFEPYGLGNPHPLLACKNIRASSPKIIGKNNEHLSFDIINDESKIRAIAWNCSDHLPLIENEAFDLAYETSLNEWNGEVSVQCIVANLESVEEPNNFPNREQLLIIYNFLRRRKNSTNKFELFELLKNFNGHGKNCSTSIFDVAIKIFEELGLLTIDNENKIFDLPRPKNKLNLNNSRTFRLGRKKNRFTII